MPDGTSRFLKEIIRDKGEPGDSEKSFTSERQLTAQALALHVDYRDGLSSEGATWSHLGRYKWRDCGEHESLRIIFGPMCAMEILGLALGTLVAEIREGQLNGIREIISSAAKLAAHEGQEGPVIFSVTAYPDFDELFEEIRKEAEERGKDDAKHAGRIRR